jgi:ferredoxin
MKIAIIGSGPTGLACIKTILESEVDILGEVSITLYDIADNINENPNSNLNRATALKDYFGDAFSYDQNRTTLITGLTKPSNLWSSGGLGGFSRVWGATLIGVTDKSFFGSFYESIDTNSDLLTEGGKRLHSIYEDISINVSKNLERVSLKLAVDSKLCTSCGDCLKGCPQDAIWCSSTEILNNKLINFESKEAVKVLKILDRGISVESISKKKIFDKVFIAAGPLSTASILFNSDLIEGDYFLNDSQTVFNLYLSKPTRKSSKKFALAQASFNLKVKGQMRANVQVYPCGESLVEKLGANEIIGKLPSKILLFLSRFIVAGIAYLPPDASGKIHLSKGEKGELVLNVSDPKKKKIKMFSYIYHSSKLFRRIGLWQIPAVEYAGIGEGYHFGNLQAGDGSEYLETLALKGVYVVGAAALKELPVGPITDHIVFDTIIRVKAALKVS